MTTRSLHEIQRKRRKFLWVGAAGFLLGSIAAVFLLREPAETLTPSLLASAQQRWREAGIHNYEMRYRMHGSEYRISVRDGLVLRATVNGVDAITSDVGAFSVEGLFRTLEQELENLSDTAGPFGSQAKSVLMRARFHPRLGYLERYVRSGGGHGRGVAIELVEFCTVPESNPLP